MWYSLNDLLSKNRLLSFVIGSRGGGKTFASQMWCIKDSIKHMDNIECKHKFIWLRRYESEITQIKNNWCSKDLRDKFPNNEITTKGKYIYVDGKQVGMMVALSTSQRLKSVDFHDYDKIIFDEFLIDKGSLRYINSEVELYLEFFETVNRLSDRVRGVFVANAISIVNPYFTYFKIKPNLDNKFTMNEHIAIELYKDETFISKKKQTKLGALITNTSYGDYAIENKFLRDNYSFIAERPTKNCIYSMTLVYNKVSYGVWLHLGKDTDCLYIDNIIEDKCKRVLSVTMDDLNEQCKYRKYDGLKPHVEQLKYMFAEGKIYYDNIQTKKEFFELIKVL